MWWKLCVKITVNYLTMPKSDKNLISQRNFIKLPNMQEVRIHKITQQMSQTSESVIKETSGNNKYFKLKIWGESLLTHIHHSPCLTSCLGELHYIVLRKHEIV